MRISSILLILLLFIACSSSPVPKGVLKPKEMEKVVYDLIRADEFINNFLIKDSTVDIKKKRSVLYEQVFKVHNTTRKEFYSSYKYYQSHPDIQKGLFDSMYESINRAKPEMHRDRPVP